MKRNWYFANVILLLGCVLSIQANEAQLVASIYAGDIQEVKELVKSGADVNDPVPVGGMSLLHVAALFGRLEIADILIENGADVDAQDDNLDTPLHILCNPGRLQKEKDVLFVKELLEAGANTNCKNNKGASSFHYAICGQCVDIIRAYISTSVNVNIKEDFQGRTPLHFAVELGNSEVIKLLIEAKADVNSADSNGETPLYVLLGREKRLEEDIYILKILSDAGMHIDIRNKIGITPFHNAILKEDKEMAEILIVLGADVNDPVPVGGMSPLHLIAIKGNVELARLLIESGADVDYKDERGDTPLCYAKKRAYTDFINLLISFKSGN